MEPDELWSWRQLACDVWETPGGYLVDGECPCGYFEDGDARSMGVHEVESVSPRNVILNLALDGPLVWQSHIFTELKDSFYLVKSLVLDCEGLAWCCNLFPVAQVLFPHLLHSSLYALPA